MGNVTCNFSLKNAGLALVGSLVLAYAFVIVFLMIGPTYIGGKLAITQFDKLTVIVAPFLAVPLYFLLVRRDRNRRVHGL